MPTHIDTWTKRLESRAGPWWLALLAACLALPSLGLGAQTDDHMLLDLLERQRPDQEFFRISEAQLERGRDHGGFVWWSAEHGSLRFWRPLSVASHRLDYALWGASPLPMHAFNVLLYALVVAVAALVLRRLLPARAALLAGLMYAMNGAHAQSAGWISSRNTVLSVLFALLCLHTQLRAEQDGKPALRWLGAGCLALSLASGEAGLVAVAYLLGHALWGGDSGTPARRLRALWAHGLVLLGWGAHYVAGGYGSHGLGWYRDPLGEPLWTLSEGVMDLPVWLFSQLGLSSVGALAAVPPGYARLGCLLLVTPLLITLWPVLRRQPRARFGAVLMALAILPLCATVPQDRMLLGASLGAVMWIALALQDEERAVSWARRLGLRTLRVLHLWTAPLLFLVSLATLGPIDGGARALAAALPAEEGARVMLVNAPLELLERYAPLLRRNHGQHEPASLHTLYTGASPLRVTRPDARTLELEAEQGWARTPIERIFVTPHGLPRAGGTRRLGEVQVHVVESTTDGRPRRVRFQFGAPLEEDRTWLVWQAQGPVPWMPPAVGESRSLAPLSLSGSLPRH